MVSRRCVRFCCSARKRLPPHPRRGVYPCWADRQLLRDGRPHNRSEHKTNVHALPLTECARIPKDKGRTNTRDGHPAARKHQRQNPSTWNAVSGLIYSENAGRSSTCSAETRTRTRCAMQRRSNCQPSAKICRPKTVIPAQRCRPIGEKHTAVAPDGDLV